MVSPDSVTPRERLARRALYLVCAARGRASGRCAAALRGGVDLIQLRDKTLDDDGLVARRAEFRAAADAHDALFILNDRPDLVEACGADGVHVGQDDGAPAARARPSGRTGSSAARRTRPSRPRPPSADPDVDYLAVGPVHATPTKPGRPAAGLHYVAHAASTCGKPWFAIGGLDAGNVHEVVERGATRIVVVRAITEADDPEARRARCEPRWRARGRVAASARRDARRLPAGAARGDARARERNEQSARSSSRSAPGERPLAVTSPRSSRR